MRFLVIFGRQTCCTRFLYSTLSDHHIFFHANFLACGCIRVRFLRLNFFTFRQNEYSASFEPLSYSGHTKLNNQQFTLEINSSACAHAPFTTRQHMDGPSNPRADPRNCRAGTYRAGVSWALLPCDGHGQAVKLKNVIGWAGPRHIVWKNDGPGRAAAFQIKV